MSQFRIRDYKRFNEIPLSKLNNYNHSIYILDFNWNYLFVNEFVKKNLGNKGNDLIGKNMWEFFSALKQDTAFLKMKKETEYGRDTDFISTSPLTGQRLHVKGHRLSDCYFFSSSILPVKEELLNELRGQLNREFIEKRQQSKQ